MSILEALAGGLRQAGGVLSAPVQRTVMEQDQNDATRQYQTRQLYAQQVIKAAESGALAPEQAQAALARLGMPDIPVGPDAATQGRQEALAKERAWQVAAADAAGDPVRLAGAAAVHKPELAASLFRQQEDRAQRALESERTHQLRRDQLDQTFDTRMRQLDILESQGADKAETARQRLQMETQYRATAQALAAQGLEIRRQGQSIQQQMLQMKLAQQEQGTNAQAAKQATQLSTALEKAGLTEMSAVMDDAETALSKSPGVAGYLTGPGLMRPDFSLPKDVTDARQAMQRVFNITLKNRSGSAVTNQELDRLKQEFGQGLYKTPEQLTTALEKLRGIVTKHYQGIAAGYGPAALKLYNENLEAIGGRPVLSGRASGEVPPPPPGFVVTPPAGGQQP